MIVQESDILLAALDRRLAIDRVTTLDPLARVASSPEQPRQPSAQAGAASATDESSLPGTWATRLPLGRVVFAHVVEVPRPDRVIAEIDTLRIELAWPQGGTAAPRAGRDIALRVLAHRPMLLFQSLDAEGGTIDRAGSDGAATARWSSDALSLQPAADAQSASRSAGGARRFDTPILAIEVVGLDDVREPTDSEATPSQRTLHASAQFVLDESPSWSSSAPKANASVAPSIALDDVIVARSTAEVDGLAAPLIARTADDSTRNPAPFAPLLLQGPAWPGQPVELVVRREREDEQFDNPVLDHWCGEVVIDLPHLGRVAAHLAMSMQGLRIRLEGDEARSVDTMTGAATGLAAAFAAVDVRVAAISVGRPAADTRHPETSRG